VSAELARGFRPWLRIRSGVLATDIHPVKVLALRRPDSCCSCGQSLAVGTQAVWDASARTVRCLDCQPAPPPSIPEQVGAGSSAQREYERRSARRETAVRTRHPRLGGLLLALNAEPASTRVWAQGAQGERAVATRLEELTDKDVVALHDRRMRRPDGRLSRANIDHLAICPSGVWVVDAKTHHGKLEVRRTGGLFSPRVERLFIHGRDKTALLDGLAGQVTAVRAALSTVGADVPVRGALCFVGTELPWFGTSIGDVPLVGRRGLGKLLTKPGDLAAGERTAVASFLDQHFPPA
jgi:hypothetical protein